MRIGNEESVRIVVETKCYPGRPVEILEKSADEEHLLHQGNEITDCHRQDSIHQESLLTISNFSLHLRKTPIKYYTRSIAP